MKITESAHKMLAAGSTIWLCAFMVSFGQELTATDRVADAQITALATNGWKIEKIA